MRRLLSLMFRVGDCLFLILVSEAAFATTYLFHQFGLNRAVTLIAGMIAAMAVQMVLALCVAPILGSIESMVPSMVVAMLGPMVLCALDMAGYPLAWWGLLQVGAALGLVSYALMEIYGCVCRRSLKRAFPGT